MLVGGDVRVELFLRVRMLRFLTEERWNGRSICQLTITLELSDLDVEFLDLAVEEDACFVTQGDLLVLKLLTSVIVLEYGLGILFLFRMRHETPIQLDVLLQISIFGADSVLVLLHFSVFGLDFFHHMVDLSGQICDIVDELLQH